MTWTQLLPALLLPGVASGWRAPVLIIDKLILRKYICLPHVKNLQMLASFSCYTSDIRGKCRIYATQIFPLNYLLLFCMKVKGYCLLFRRKKNMEKKSIFEFWVCLFKGELFTQGEINKYIRHSSQNRLKKKNGSPQKAECQHSGAVPGPSVLNAGKRARAGFKRQSQALNVVFILIIWQKIF